MSPPSGRVLAGDERHLRRAVELALTARAAGDEPYGALLVGPDGSVLVEDRNTVVTDRDVTAHAELKLARWAVRELPAERVGAVTMYTSCEPCTMCATAIAHAGVGRVVFALSTAQHDELRAPAAGAVVHYDGPALYEEARRPLEGYQPP